MADLATLQARLAEAELAYHELVTKKRPISLTIEGRAVTYQAGETAMLRDYITSLKAEVKQAGNVQTPQAIGFVF